MAPTTLTKPTLAEQNYAVIDDDTHKDFHTAMAPLANGGVWPKAVGLRTDGTKRPTGLGVAFGKMVLPKQRSMVLWMTMIATSSINHCE